MKWITNEQLFAPPPDLYVVRDTPFSLFLGGETPIDKIVYWWNGVVSFDTAQSDPALFAAQVAFMGSATRSTDMTQFPGNFISTGFPGADEERHIVNGLTDFDKEPGFYQFGDAIPVFVTGWGFTNQVMFTQDDFSIYAPRRDVLARINGVDFGPYSSTNPVPPIFHFSDFNVVDGLRGADAIDGSNAPDAINGRGGDDVLQGHDGADALDGGGGADILYGGAGNDRLTGGAGTDQLIGKDGNDVLVGDRGTDTLTGGSGRDDLRGGGGNDTLVAGDGVAGAAALVVGFEFTYHSPNDGGNRTTEKSLTGLFDLSADPNVEDATRTYHATVDASAPNLFLFEESHYFSFEVASAGSRGVFDIDGTDGLNSYLEIYDSAGTLVAFQDDASVLDPGSSSTLDSYLTTTFAAAGTYYVRVTSSETINGLPNPAVDTAYTLHVSLTDPARPGSTLYGGTEDDTLSSGRADDLLDGGSGNDTASFAGAAAGVTVDLVAGLATGGAGRDQLVGIENLGGSRFADSLFGDAGNNRLSGGGGGDFLVGGGGVDVLNGGAGNDRFGFAAAPGPSALTTIEDFTIGDDIFALDRSFLTALGADGPLASSAFRLGATALDADDRILFDKVSGAVFYDADGNGAGAAAQIFAVTPGLALTAADFTIVG